MAKTIPQLTDATTVNASDELIIQQGGITKRATATELAKGLNTINGTVNVRDFGAVGDGVADDTAAIQAAIDSASVIYFPPGIYRLTSTTYDATTDWRHHIVIPSNRSLIFNGAKITTTTPFESRAVVLLARGSNIAIKGGEFVDSHDSGNPFVITVGGGTTYDSSYPVGTLSGLRVSDCVFRNAWLSVSIQFSSADSGDKFFEDIQIANCTSCAKPNNTSSGNFNVRSDGPWKIKNVTISDCVACDGYSASSFNIYGVDGFSVSNCASYRNLYAGCEMENGAQDGTVTSFRSVDDFWGVWVDDSRRIVVNGVSHKTLSESVTGLLGTNSRIRNALLVTRQGFTNFTDWQTTQLSFSNVVSEFGKVSMQSFGSAPAGSIGRLQFSNISIIADGQTRATGNTLVEVLSVPEDVRFNNIYVSGAPEKAFNIGTTNGSVTLSNVTTNVVNAEISTGIAAAGTGSLTLNNVNTHSQDIDGPVITATNYVVGGTQQPDRRAQQRFYYAVTGDPEGSLSAGPGSTAHRVDDGKLYIKGSGTGNTGWLLVTAS